MPTRLTPPHCLTAVNEATLSFWLCHPCFFVLKAEKLFLVSANSDKTPHHTHLQHDKISQNHIDDRPPFLLTASCEGPSPTALFQLKLKLPPHPPISLLHISGSMGVVKRHHNHIKIGINDPELLRYRYGKSKST